MTQRERILAIAVGGLLLAVIIHWGFNKYKTAVNQRNNQINNLVQQQQQLNEQILQGEYANRQMGEYRVRSLSGDPEQAQSEYQQWLLDTINQHDVSKATVDKNSSRTIGDLYQQIEFRVQGNTDMPNLIELLHQFYAKDYLHRIRDLSIRPSREGDYRVEMSIDAIALLSAPEELPARDQPSWRVDQNVTTYREPILNRNFFQPPNQPPRFGGNSEIEAVVGRETPAALDFEDPEGDALKYEIAGETPDGVQIDPNSGTLRIHSDEKREFELLVRATDSGYPRRTIEQPLKVRVVDPPPPPAEPEPELAFDDAKQTVLTALVQGREEWTAWMNIRTRAETLRLRVGDQFEIGSLKGKIVEATPQSVTIESDGKRFTLEPGDNLSEAAKTPADE